MIVKGSNSVNDKKGNKTTCTSDAYLSLLPIKTISVLISRSQQTGLFSPLSSNMSCWGRWPGVVAVVMVCMEIIIIWADVNMVYHHIHCVEIVDPCFKNLFLNQFYLV